ncbi:MAG TPA: T9SS type A sorting domain-containing protein [Chitinophagales bacterium]|nr:T9SS type A sorting domain-containing protein [Chitinophagales bacterium]
MKNLILSSLIYTSCFCSAQKQDNNWCFGDSCGINFSDTTATFFTSASSFDTTLSNLNLENISSISDSAGNLLFYSNGSIVWNANHEIMQNGLGLYSNTSVTNGSLIIQRPNDSSLYYLFHINNYIDHFGLFYALVDMNLDQGLGGVVSGQKNVTVYHGHIGEKLSAVKHANGRDWWIIVRKDETNDFYTYLLTPDSIALFSILTIGTIAALSDQGEMTFSHSGEKLALVGYDGIINLFDFDRCTGAISNFIDLSDSSDLYYYGCSFSLGGLKLYVSTFKYLYQFDLTDSNIIDSKQLIWTNPYYIFPYDEFLLCEHQITPDGRIFIPLAHNMSQNVPDTFINKSLCVINNPDEVGAACNFIPNEIYLGGHHADYGLPNSPNYNLGALEGSACDTLATSVSKNIFSKTISLYPNPFTNEVTISMKNLNKGKCYLEVYEVAGKQVCRQPLKSSSTSLNLGYLQNGMYLYQVKEENEVVWRGKMVKE